MSWSCDADVSDKLMHVIFTELDSIPGHPQSLAIRDIFGLQLVLLQEAEKLEVIYSLAVNSMIPSTACAPRLLSS